MRIALLTTIILSLVLSCSKQVEYSSQRALASSNAGKSVRDKIENILDGLHVALDQETTTYQSCHESLENYFSRLYSLNSSSIKSFSLQDFDSTLFIEKSILARIKIQAMLKRLGKLDSLNKQLCFSSVVDIFQALRYLEDYLIEIDHLKKPSNEEFKTLQGTGKYFFINPKFDAEFDDYKDLKSGDIILSRGNAFSSASIARVSLDDMQFSHISLVYEDKKTNLLYTIESHIEIGNVVAPIKTHIKQNNARTVVYRHPDPELAHKAAREMYERVLRPQSKGKNISYDFKMDYTNHDEIFCSEVAHIGYKVASDGLIDLPFYKSKFDPGISSFLQLLGISVDEKSLKTKDTFAPGDIQFDPRFEMVAEWRNPNKLKDSRYKDLVLQKIFEWMSKEQYQFKFNVSTKGKTSLAWILRRFPNVFENFGVHEQFPLNIPYATLNLFLTLDQAASPLYNHIKKLEDNTQSPLSTHSILFILEDFKLHDLKKYQDYKDANFIKRAFMPKPAFHLYFSPKK